MTRNFPDKEHIISCNKIHTRRLTGEEEGRKVGRKSCSGQNAMMILQSTPRGIQSMRVGSGCVTRTQWSGPFAYWNGSGDKGCAGVTAPGKFQHKNHQCQSLLHFPLYLFSRLRFLLPLHGQTFCHELIWTKVSINAWPVLITWELPVHSLLEGHRNLGNRQKETLKSQSSMSQSCQSWVWWSNSIFCPELAPVLVSSFVCLSVSEHQMD